MLSDRDADEQGGATALASRVDVLHRQDVASLNLSDALSLLSLAGATTLAEGSNLLASLGLADTNTIACSHCNLLLLPGFAGGSALFLHYWYFSRSILLCQGNRLCDFNLVLRSRYRL